MKCEGLSDEDAHRVVVPTSPLMTVAGIPSYLRWGRGASGSVRPPWRARHRPGLGADARVVDDPEFRVQGLLLGALLEE